MYRRKKNMTRKRKGWLVVEITVIGLLSVTTWIVGSGHWMLGYAKLYPGLQLERVDGEYRTFYLEWTLGLPDELRPSARTPRS